MRFYTYAVPKTLCAVLERDLCRLHCISGEIVVEVECCLYVVICNKYYNITCILSVLARKVHVVFAYMNLCSSEFSFKETLSVLSERYLHMKAMTPFSFQFGASIILHTSSSL